MGVGGRRFKSYHADQNYLEKTNHLRLVFLCLKFATGKTMVKLPSDLPELQLNSRPVSML